MGKHYFAADGSYGDAGDAVVVDTTDWNALDWISIEESSDNSRIHAVGEIVSRRKSNWVSSIDLID